jgi:hypothetical protein
VSWRTQDTPSPADANATLRGIDAAGPGDVWAVGWTVAAGGRHRTLAMHSDGSRWRVVPTPNPGPGDHVLSSVAAVGPAEAWAVGWTIPRPDRERASILRWDGHGWRPSPLPYIAGRAQLTDVAAVGPDDVWAVGRATDRTQTFRSLVLHWDGSAWERVEAPSVGIEDDTLAGVAVAKRSPWGVGTAVDQGGIYSSLVLHGC